MQTKLLPVTTVLKTAWDKVYGTKGTFMAAFAICFVIALVLGGIEGAVKSHSTELAYPIQFMAELIKGLLQMGLIIIGLERAFNLPISFKDLFIPFKLQYAWRLLGVFILQIIIYSAIFLPAIIVIYLQAQQDPNQTSILGLILGAIGFILVVCVSVWMAFSIAYVAQHKMNPLDAIKSSFRITQNNFWRLLGLGILEVLILVVSILTIGIALIWTLPLLFIAYGEAFKYLSTDSQVV